MFAPLAMQLCLNKVCKKVLGALFLGACLLLTAAYSSAQDDAIDILIIHSYNEHIPWNKSFTKGLESYASESDIRFNIFRVYLDVYRVPLEAHEPELVSAMRARFSPIGIDIVVGESDEAVMFLLQNKDSFAPDAAEIVFSSFSVKSDINRLVLDQDIVNVADRGARLAVGQNPDAQTALIIHGNHSEASVRVEALRHALKNFPDIDVEIVEDYSLTSLRERLTTFPASGIIFYSLVFQDSTGKNYAPKVFLDALTDVSAAPIYVGYSPLMGGGSVGGYMIDGEILAHNILLAATDYHQRGAFLDRYKATTEQFDGTAMQRYGIDASNLSADAIVVNKPKAFEELLAFILGALVVLVFFVAGVTYLARRNSRLRGLNQTLEKTRAQLDQTNKTLSRLAMYDPLTEVYNRRATLPLIIEAMKQAQRGEAGAAIILLDIDHFKVVNDTHGHVVGDEILKELVSVIRKSLRTNDVLARWGGEEFLVLLRVSDYGDAGVVAEKIRRSVEEAAFTALSITITVSAGVAPLSLATGFDEAFKLADKSLYASKDGGRNRVTIAQKGQGDSPF